MLHFPAFATLAEEADAEAGSLVPRATLGCWRRHLSPTPPWPRSREHHRCRPWGGAAENLSPAPRSALAAPARTNEVSA